jgi:DNA (cytosine-5)-methyltransferase 1
MKPKLLDLFCGAGGCSMGYHRAGFEVVGVDINPQPHYPFQFYQANALEFPLSGFDAVHASPPCQAYSIASKAMRNKGRVYPDLVAPVRDRLITNGKPWVIENVPGAPIRPDAVLCGCMFGLKGLRRKRWFELSWHPLFLFNKCNHDPDELVISVVGNGTPSWNLAKWGRCPTIAEAREAMGISWMTQKELSQAIPPAYTEFIGKELRAHVLCAERLPDTKETSSTTYNSSTTPASKQASAD